MAQNWIKWTKGVSRRREVLAMSRELNVDRRIIACCCFEFWEWADDNTTTGKLPGVTTEFIDGHVTLPGFAKALEKERWLTIKDGVISIPRFVRHNGDSSKKRAKDAERQAKKRSKDVTNPSQKKCDETRTRPDQIRQDSGNGILMNLTLEELQQSPALLARYKQCVDAGVGTVVHPGGAVSLLRFFGAAERALEIGKDNPPGFFRRVVLDGLWGQITNHQEDRAARKLKALDRSQGGPR